MFRSVLNIFRSYLTSIKHVKKLWKYKLLILWVSSVLPQTNFVISAGIIWTYFNVCNNPFLFFVYALVMLHNSLNMIKVDQNMSELWQIVCKNIILTLVLLLVYCLLINIWTWIMWVAYTWRKCTVCLSVQYSTCTELYHITMLAWFRSHWQFL
jgi:hypothetical protein